MYIKILVVLSDNKNMYGGLESSFYAGKTNDHKALNDNFR